MARFYFVVAGEVLQGEGGGAQWLLFLLWVRRDSGKVHWLAEKYGRERGGGDGKHYKCSPFFLVVVWWASLCLQAFFFRRVIYAGCGTRAEMNKLMLSGHASGLLTSSERGMGGRWDPEASVRWFVCLWCSDELVDGRVPRVRLVCRRRGIAGGTKVFKMFCYGATGGGVTREIHRLQPKRGRVKG